MDHEALRCIAEDLAFLRAWSADISNPEIRRGSATLRRLLIENAYGNAWRAAGLQKEPRLIAVDLKNIVAATDIPKVVFVLAAGAEFRGMYIASPMISQGNKPLPPVNSAVLRENGYPGEREFGLTEYLRSHSAFAFGEWISRADVIKYIANVKGGVHLSASQRRREAELVNRVSKIEKRVNVHGTEGLLLELVAIAQAIGRSDDASRLISALNG
jgi:hypothetical protein